MRAEPKIATPRLHVREVVEPLDELAHDAHHAPGIGAREVLAAASRLQEFFVFGDGRYVAANRVVDDPRRRRRAARRPLRRRRAPRRAVSRFRPLAISLLRRSGGFGEDSALCRPPSASPWLVGAHRLWLFGARLWRLWTRSLRLDGAWFSVWHGVDLMGLREEFTEASLSHGGLPSSPPHIVRRHPPRRWRASGYARRRARFGRAAGARPSPRRRWPPHHHVVLSVGHRAGLCSVSHGSLPWPGRACRASVVRPRAHGLHVPRLHAELRRLSNVRGESATSTPTLRRSSSCATPASAHSM